MRTPQGEARRIVEELSGQMVNMPEKLQKLPRVFFEQLCASDDFAQTVAAIAAGIAAEPALAGRSEYLVAVLKACANAAACFKLPGDMTWEAAMEAQRHAGVALAYFVTFSDAKAVKSALGNHAKEVQIAMGQRFRLYVLREAADSTRSKMPSEAADHVVRLLEARGGGLREALKELGAQVRNIDSESFDRASAVRHCADIIRADMKNLVTGSCGTGSAQAQSKIRFARWKILYVSQANG